MLDSSLDGRSPGLQIQYCPLAVSELTHQQTIVKVGCNGTSQIFLALEQLNVSRRTKHLFLMN